MGWDIAGWLGIGGNDGGGSKSKVKELREERNEYRDRLKEQEREAKKRQKAYDQQQAALTQSVVDLQIRQNEQAAAANCSVPSAVSSVRSASSTSSRQLQQDA